MKPGCTGLQAASCWFKWEGKVTQFPAAQMLLQGRAGSTQPLQPQVGQCLQVLVEGQQLQGAHQPTLVSSSAHHTL